MDGLNFMERFADPALRYIDKGRTPEGGSCYYPNGYEYHLYQAQRICCRLPDGKNTALD